MKVMPREARKITYSTEIRNLKKLGFSQYQKSVLVGCILGDGCLCSNWSKTNYRMLISQSADQLDYVLWKHSIFKTWVLSKPRYYKRNNSYSIRTISHPELTTLRHIFYQNNRKVIPHNIDYYVSDPLTVAVWFMDDGNKMSTYGNFHGYHLNSQSFSKEENMRIAHAFKSVHGIECTVQKNKTYHRLYIKTQSRNRFRSFIEPYILPQMKYKLG